MNRYQELTSSEDSALSISVPNEVSRSSLVPTKDNVQEVQFLEAASKGDVKAMKFILKNETIDVNCVDSQGLSALHWAIKNNDEAMVNFLIKMPNLRVRDCALHAIKLDQPRHVKMIMDLIPHSTKDGINEQSPYIGSNEFADYVTPMMVAAQHGHVGIINLLFNRGHAHIIPPHRPKCLCEDCMISLKSRDVLASMAYKLQVYQAICNPAYICHITDDPITKVFRLAQDLREMGKRNRVFLREYEALTEQTEKFAADLIALCRTSAEVNAILGQRQGTDFTEVVHFPQLVFAVDYKQKQFVAQRNVQAILEEAWVGDWYEWRSYSDFRRILQFAGRVFMLPILYIVCFFLPGSKWSKFYSIPLNRMISSVASYFIFLLLLLLESNRDKINQSRHNIMSKIWPLAFVWVYVLSFIVNSFQMWAVRGFKRFFTFNWNLYDLTTQLVLFLSFLYWICSLSMTFWQPDLERKYWIWFDPQLMFEGFFCIGTVMAFSRLLLLVQIHHTLGPLQVSLAKMTSDCLQFIIIFAIVIGSFTAGLCRFYQYYENMVQVDPDTKEIIATQETSFVSVSKTFIMLFWGLFTMSDQNAGSVVIENLPSENGKRDVIHTHDFTEAVGYTLFAVFTVITSIVLMNMLIAAMSNTYQRITENVDVEWIFGRTEVYLAYMGQTVMPPPFNLRLAHRDDLGTHPKLEYHQALKNVVQRYISQPTQQ